MKKADVSEKKRENWRSSVMDNICATALHNDSEWLSVSYIWGVWG